MNPSIRCIKSTTTRVITKSFVESLRDRIWQKVIEPDYFFVCLPLASTKWFWSTFSSHCPLPSNRRFWSTSTMLLIFFHLNFFGNAGNWTQGSWVWKPVCSPLTYASPSPHDFLSIYKSSSANHPLTDEGYNFWKKIRLGWFTVEFCNMMSSTKGSNIGKMLCQKNSFDKLTVEIFFEWPQKLLLHF